jgi:hypothetical protein
MAATAPVVVKVECRVRLWPSFWRHPIRHVRLRRFWRRHERENRKLFVGSALRQKITEAENEALLTGKGEREGP